MFGNLKKIMDDTVWPGDASPVSSISDFLGIAINVSIGIGISLSIIFLAYSGIQIMTSTSDPKKLDQAKNAFFYSLAAMGVSFLAVTFKIISVNLLGATGDVANDLPGF